MAEAGDHYIWDLFISYSRADEQWVRNIFLPVLQQAGLRYQVDEPGAGQGVPVVRSAEEGARGSHHTVVVLSPAYLAHKAQTFKLLAARKLPESQGPTDRRHHLIPLMIVDCLQLLPPRLSQPWVLKLCNPRQLSANLPRLIKRLQAAKAAVSAPYAGGALPPIHLPPPAGAFSPWHVPRPAEAAQVLRALGLPGAPDSKGAAIVGAEGVGKTALAAWLLADERVRRRWPDGVLWATLGPATIANNADAAHVAGADALLLQWGEALGEKGLGERPRAEDKAAILRGLLAHRRVLLVVDDAREVEPARLLLDCAGPGCGRLLITRQEEVAAALGYQPVRLGALAPAEALALLAERAGEGAMRRVSPEEAAELCERLGRLPVALHLAGAGLRMGAPVGEYLAARDKPPASVRACLDIGVARLEGEERRRYALLGALAEGVPFGAQEAAIVWGLGPDDPDIPRLLRWLAQQGLLDPSEEDQTPRYRQPAPLYAYARELLGADQQLAAEERHAAGFAALARQYRRWENWPAIEALHPQALAALERAARAGAEGGPPDPLISEYVDALRKYWDMRGMVALARAWGEVAVECCRALGRRYEEGIHLGNLGSAYTDLGEPLRAIACHEQALAVMRELGQRQAEANTLGNLGSTHRDLGDLRRASAYYEQALLIARQTGEWRKEAAWLGNLGNLYDRLGEARRAIGYYERALAIDRDLGDRQGEGVDLSNLGSCHQRLREAARAIYYGEQALAIARETGYRQGESHRLHSLAVAYVDGGQAARGREYAEQALAIARRLGDRTLQGYALKAVGLARVALGEVAEGLACYEQALVIARKTRDPRLEGEALGRRGEAHARLGDGGRAAEDHARALALWQRLGDRLMEARQRELLGQALQEQGNLAEAREQLAGALALYRAVGLPTLESEGD